MSERERLLAELHRLGKTGWFPTSPTTRGHVSESVYQRMEEIARQLRDHPATPPDSAVQNES